MAWKDRNEGGTNGVVIGRRMHRSFVSPSLRLAQARLAQDDSPGEEQSRMIRLETPALSLQNPAVAKN